MKCHPVTKCCRLFSFLVQFITNHLWLCKDTNRHLTLITALSKIYLSDCFAKQWAVSSQPTHSFEGMEVSTSCLGIQTFSQNTLLQWSELSKSVKCHHFIKSHPKYSTPSHSPLDCELNDYCKEEKEYLIRSWVVWWRKRGTKRYIL